MVWWGVLEDKHRGQILLSVYVLPELFLSQHSSVQTPDKDQDLTNQVPW